MKKETVAVLAVAIALAAVALLAVGTPSQADDALPRFQDEDEFREYLEKTPSLQRTNMVFQGAGADGAAPTVERELDAAQQSEASSQPATRYSTTNIQEHGIDEPDVLKNTENAVYYSSRGRETRVISPDPVDDPSVTHNISRSGELLVHRDTLVLLSNDIHGYNVSGEPAREWSLGLNHSTSVVSARLYDGTVYLVLRQTIDRDHPCPIKPYEDGVVRCSEVRHPPTPVDVDTTYTVLKLDPGSGDVLDRTSFVGSSRNTVVYMSSDSVYITYTEQKDAAEVFTEFAVTDGRDLFPQSTLNRLEQLQEYRLSSQAKLVELRAILRDWRQSLDRDERMRVENEFRERYRSYVRENVRSFTQTNVVEIGADNLDVRESGSVPGTPLNQWSIDEQDGYLRIATTVGGRSAFVSMESANDLYVLDGSLDVTGSVEGMGLNERIYSVRFMEDQAYVVTFRRIDPFHVVDLSDPDDPSLEGELKLPGFSSYLHPLPGDRVLGIGMEDRQVKAVVFDVSDPTDPRVLDDYVLQDYSTDVLRNHHAFLHDPRHEAFFLPGSRGGYVFTYRDGLELEATFDTGSPARRAVYRGDYMYVFSDTELVVVDEDTWTRASTLEFREPRRPTPRPTPRPAPERRGTGDGATDDTTREPVRAGVNVAIDSTDDRVEVTYVSRGNADHLEVRFGGDVEAETVTLNEVGDRAKLTNDSIEVTGEACYGDRCGGEEYDVADGVRDGESVSVTVAGVSGDRRTVVLDESDDL